MWRDCDSSTFLVGMQNYIAALENSVVGPQKAKCGVIK